MRGSSSARPAMLHPITYSETASRTYLKAVCRLSVSYGRGANLVSVTQIGSSGIKIVLR